MPAEPAPARPAASSQAAEPSAPSEAAGEPAETADCPPGWYCEPLPLSERHTPQGPVPVEPSVPPGEAAPPVESVPPSEGSSRAPARVRFTPPAVDGDPDTKVRTRSWLRWGIGARGSLALMNSLEPHRSAIGGLGLVGKYRPFRSVQFDLAVDAFTGHGYHHEPRQELAFSLGVSLTPHLRRPIRPMLLAATGYSLAHVGTGRAARNLNHVNTTFGGGVEIDVVEGWSVGLELVALLRWRVDTERRPEFTDPYRAAATDVSGGGLLRLGLSHYF